MGTKYGNEIATVVNNLTLPNAGQYPDNTRSTEWGYASQVTAFSNAVGWYFGKVCLPWGLSSPDLEPIYGDGAEQGSLCVIRNRFEFYFPYVATNAGGIPPLGNPQISGVSGFWGGYFSDPSSNFRSVNGDTNFDGLPILYTSIINPNTYITGVVASSGSAGDNANPCTFKYKQAPGNPSDSEFTPILAERPSSGKMAAATRGLWMFAGWKTSGSGYSIVYTPVWALISTNEYLVTLACTTGS